MVGTKKEILEQLEQYLPDNDDLIGLTYWGNEDVEAQCEAADVDPKDFINNFDLLTALIDGVSITDDLFDLICATSAAKHND